MYDYKNRLDLCVTQHTSKDSWCVYDNVYFGMIECMQLVASPVSNQQSCKPSAANKFCSSKRVITGFNVSNNSFTLITQLFI